MVAQTTGLGCEDIDLIGALPHITKQAFNGIGRLNMSVHALRKRIKGQEVFFVLNQAPYRFWIALSVLGFEGDPEGRFLVVSSYFFFSFTPTLVRSIFIEQLLFFWLRWVSITELNHTTSSSRDL